VDERNLAIHLWDSSTFEEKQSIHIDSPVILSYLRLNGDGSVMVGSRENGSALIIDTKSWQGVGDFKDAEPFSIKAISFAPRTRRIATADGGKTVQLWRWDGVSRGDAVKEKTVTLPDLIHDISFSTDERLLACASENGDVVVLDTDKWEEVGRLKSYSNRIEKAGLTPDSSLLLTQVWYDSEIAWDLNMGTMIDASTKSVSFPKEEWTDKGSVKSHEFLVKNSRGDYLNLEGTDGRNICVLVLQDKERTWVAVASDGRFDTNVELEKAVGAHWILANDSFNPLPLEIFMRDYYEPRLLPRLLAGEELPKLRSLASLNRVQPLVEVEKADWEDATNGTARVAVKVSGNKGVFPRGGKQVEVSTAVYDLRLFRDGQLVGWAPKSSVEWQLEPPATGAHADELDLQRWREKTRVGLDPDGTKQLSFVVQVPRRADLKQVTFTAYAFNEDRVKSATASGTLTVNAELKPRMGKAYIVSVGVNRTESSPNWDLQYAGNDARKLSEVVSQKLGGTKQFSTVIPVLLVSDQPGLDKAGEAAATKGHLQSVLDVLAGRRKADEQLKREIPGSERLERAQPEDLVLLAFSSHGYTDERGVFHMVLADIGKDQPQDHVTEKLQKRTLSSDELSGWLREVDAGELVMIVDTCHSEATVAYDGFKPGPMGSRGLGQLAYDKGMRILAASKSGQSAIELGGDIKEGLLSYALVHEGLEEGKADFQPKDGRILMSEWLAYGAQEVPNLFTFGRAKGPNEEKPTVGNTKDIIYLGPDQAPPSYQQPVLFDFAKTKTEVFLMSPPSMP
jgi:hypothetical protein